MNIWKKKARRIADRLGVSKPKQVTTCFFCALNLAFGRLA